MKSIDLWVGQRFCNVLKRNAITFDNHSHYGLLCVLTEE